jgi:DMSO reductase anchor subunit
MVVLNALNIKYIKKILFFWISGLSVLCRTQLRRKIWRMYRWRFLDYLSPTSWYTRWLIIIFFFRGNVDGSSCLVGMPLCCLIACVRALHDRLTRLIVFRSLIHIIMSKISAACQASVSAANCQWRRNCMHEYKEKRPWSEFKLAISRFCIFNCTVKCLFQSNNVFGTSIQNLLVISQRLRTC